MSDYDLYREFDTVHMTFTQGFAVFILMFISYKFGRCMERNKDKTAAELYKDNP